MDAVQTETAMATPTINHRLRSRWSILARLHRWTRWGPQAAVNILCPPQCQLCGEDVETRASEALLCATCLPLLATLRGPICPRCGAPVPEGSGSKPDCPRCETWQFHFSSAMGLGIYRRELGTAALMIKQPFYEPLALTLGQLLADQVSSRWPDFHPDLVVPIPMYWWRHWLRGHNGPALLAEAAARRLGISLAADALVCHRNVRRQSTLTPAERATNMRGAFRASGRYRLQGTTVLLIDDTLTTGATASEAAFVLKNAGVRETRVAVVARGIGVD